MRNLSLPLQVASLACLLFLVSCQKKDLTDYTPESPPSWDEKKQILNPCTFFFYKDTVYYLQNQGPDYIVNPANLMKGKYGSVPKGLAIDSSNGKINVTESETGLRYKIYFVKNGYDTCFKYVTISGINYLDSVYVLDTDDTLATPLYNASQTALLPCDDDDEEEEEEDDDDGCEFDDGDDDDGPDDEPPSGEEIIPQGIAIDKTNGAIDLKQTVDNGTFGEIPENGASLDVTLYYRLNDASGLALNFLDIRFYYFETMADVPAELLEEMEEKIDITYLNGKTTKTRPPYIVIVGKLY